MTKAILSASLCMLISFISRAQSTFRPFAGAGYGMENRLGFRGITLQGGAEYPFTDHLSAVIGADFFFSRSVPKWGEAENAGAYFRQVTPSVKIQYSTGAEPGKGLILFGGFAIRTGKTYHFESGEYHNGTFLNPLFITEKISGHGFILGAGYGFRLSETLLGRIEFSNHTFLMLNDQYTMSFKVRF
jgi:hypothetical protein